MTCWFVKAICLMYLCAPPAPDSPNAIVIAENYWSSQIVLSQILGSLLESLGYSVVFRPSDTDRQFEALGRGLIHVQLEVWEGTMKESFERELATGRIIDVGSHDAESREEWWYPHYVEELCPGLPDWRALNECAHLFATMETQPKGRFLTGPWEKYVQQRIDALGLNFVAVEAPQPDTLWSELGEAFRRKQPILMFNWTPNSVEYVYHGHFVDFPIYRPDCESIPSWGINPDALFDCGSPRNGWIKKTVWRHFPKDWPCAYKIVQRLSLTNQMFSEIAALIDFQGYTKVEAAEIWIQKHPEVWAAWIPAECRQE
ncbi:ABC transporter substrate-binding protein [Sulfidibacter corallicola]|uniref:ABC transporter substrate-binding protein n=1 Tax=Sulfidibacter corallicola TaxID=2818388 RepID=A0A8A4THP5_SULCO|nr:ABC transporter substrate-binding protein [Sulfidibacter corallicola]QTD49070.1 ABC transporter substrate-binding protein [Sulfidibacter corallicola]